MKDEYQPEKEETKNDTKTSENDTKTNENDDKKTETNEEKPKMTIDHPQYNFIESETTTETLDDGTTVTYVDFDPEFPVTRIQSLCLSCNEQGWTSFLMHDVPHFRQLIISSFSCPFCGEHNNSVQYGGVLQDKGVRFSLRVTKYEDLNRQVIKSDNAVITIPDLQLEIPPETQKGSLNTIEGILMQAYESIGYLQPVRRIEQPEAAAKIDDFLVKLNNLMEVKEPFIFLVDDFSGNSFVENPIAPQEDPELIIQHYVRTPEQDWKLGIDPEAERERKEREEDMLKQVTNPERDERSYVRVLDEDLKGEFVRAPGSDSSSIQSKDSIKILSETLNDIDIDERVLTFVVPCPACPNDGEQRMVTINIPYFKEVVVMAFNCSNCGYKNSEIKTGGSISKRGKILTLHVKNPIDLSRDVLKSDTSSLYIPEIDLRVDYGSMAGKFTTVEGVLTAIKDDISKNPFVVGDSGEQSAKERFSEFIEQMKKYIRLEAPFTLVIDDPVSNSYIQNICWPEPDEQLIELEYDRTFEHNEDLGLNDIKTENYIETDNPEKVFGTQVEDENTELPKPVGSKGKKDKTEK
jgi:zinc finger protein